MLYTVKTISSPHNDEIKQLARLVQNSRERRKQGLMVLEGIHLTDACLDAGQPPQRLYLNEAASPMLKYKPCWPGCLPV
jgi:TrmH family RNA methyltransferase